MAVTRAQFEAGMTYQAYKAQMTRNREQFEQNEREVEIGESDVRALRALPKPLNVLVLAEDWCGDVIANLPILGRLAEAAAGTLNVRVLLRDQEPGNVVMDEHLKQGVFKSIPTIIFLDQDLRELGIWWERPDSVTRVRDERRQALFRQHPEWGDPSRSIAELSENVRTQVQQAMASIRNETKSFANAEVIRELRESAERAAGLLVG
jgi:hypothetical protein